MRHRHIGNFSRERGVVTRLCSSGDHLTVPGLGIFLPSFTEVKSSGLGGEWDPKEVCCVPSLSLMHPREGHSGTLLEWLVPLFNNFYFQEFLIYICPEFLTISEYISHIQGACYQRTHAAGVLGDFVGLEKFSSV